MTCLTFCCAWTLSIQEPQDALPEPTALTGEICVEVSQGGVALIDPRTGRSRLRIGQGHSSKAIARSNDGRWLARLLSSDTVVVHDARDGAERSRFESLPFVDPPPLESGGAPDPNRWWTEDRELRFAGDGDRIVLAQGHRSTELWSLESPERIATLALEPDAPATAFAVSSEGTRIATGDDLGRIAVWSALDGELLHPPWTLTGAVTALHFDPTSARLAIGSVGCYAHMLQLPDGELRELAWNVSGSTGFRMGLEDIRFAPTGLKVVALTGNCSPNVICWDLPSAALAWQRELDWSGGLIWYGGGSARFDPGAERLIVSGRGVVLDARSGAVLHEAFPQSAPVDLDTNGEVAWSVEGDILRLVTFDGLVSIRDVRLND